ncbi:collagenase [Streptomyces sp. NPDC088197]|uniref:collagenase n=1 Tax=unclassified Streptomyces TaxID=2593676 RepID=UPI0033B3D7D8
MCLGIGMLIHPERAAAAQPKPAGTAATRPGPAAQPATVAAAKSDHTGAGSLSAADRAPLPASKDALKQDYDAPTAPVVSHSAPSMKAAARAKARANGLTAAATCNASDFTGRTGSALVAQIKASTTDCVNTLFNLTGTDAYNAFREAQMTTVAYAMRDGSAAYPGDSSTGMPQLVLYLRAGYYVQYYNSSAVGSYGTAMVTAIRSALDAFFASAHSGDVTDANGEALAEAVTLIDSSEQDARYLYVVKRLLNGYNSSYDASWYMLNAVNNVYTVLFRGHQFPDFVAAVVADPSVLDTLYNFAGSHLALLSTDQAYLTSNAGRELGRFLQESALRAKASPLVAALLSRTAITGPTAALWVGLAEMTSYYDASNCSYYDTCNLADRLKSSVLTSNYTCSSSIRILAQDMTAAQLSSSCASLRAQDAYFHGLVHDSGPVANDNNSTIEVVVFNSSTDYQTYAGAMYGIDTNNGGMYLEGDPAAAGNQPRFIAYEAEWVRPDFQIWNLNHEYTHYLDGRFDTYGDFTASTATPTTIWWIEGFAEYVSYSYRNVVYTDAQNQAATHGYTLRSIFGNTYDSGQTLVYNWGYLAVRYMLQSHPADVTALLADYRSGNYAAAQTLLTSTIGTRYNSDWDAWLTKCAVGNCGSIGGGNPPGNQAPTAAFTSAVSNLTAAFTDRSTDSDGTIASRAWNFGDGTTSTAANPSRTYTAAGTYTVTLTVTDNGGATNTTSQTVTVGSGGGTAPECTGADVNQLGKNCKRSNLSAPTGDYAYLYLYLPAGTTTLKITSAGGTGNADLYYSSTGWATTASYTSKATGSGNAHTLTVTNPTAGYVYVSLYAVQGFSGASVTTSY